MSLRSWGRGGMLNNKGEFKGVRLQSNSGGKSYSPPLTANSGMWLIMWDLCHWEPFSSSGGHGVISSSNRLPFVQWAPGELHKTLFFFSSHIFFFTMGKWGEGMSIKQLFFPSLHFKEHVGLKFTQSFAFKVDWHEKYWTEQASEAKVTRL